MSEGIHNKTVAVLAPKAPEQLTTPERDASQEILQNEPWTLDVLLDDVIDAGLPTCDDRLAYSQAFGPAEWLSDCFLPRVRQILNGYK